MNAPRNNPRQGIRARQAFTLIELLVVIGIIVILAAILIPSLTAIKAAAMRSASMATIRQIEGGIGQYAKDTRHDGALPPYSLDNKDSAITICFLMTGWADDTGPVKGMPMENGMSIFEDDGHDGFGYRTFHRGRLFGPYNGLEKAPRMEVIENGKKYYRFVDAFGGPIWYAQFVNGRFESRDWPPAGSIDLQHYAQRHDGSYFRKDFLLMSSGQDNKWNAFRDKPDTDDVTNFLGD